MNREDGVSSMSREFLSDLDAAAVSVAGQGRMVSLAVRPVSIGYRVGPAANPIPTSSRMSHSRDSGWSLMGVLWMETQVGPVETRRVDLRTMDCGSTSTIGRERNTSRHAIF